MALNGEHNVLGSWVLSWRSSLAMALNLAEIWRRSAVCEVPVLFLCNALTQECTGIFRV